MKVPEREQILRDIFENEFLPLIAAKGHDYSVDGDCLENLRENGYKGIVMRLGDKMARLRGFVSRMDDPNNEAGLKVLDESIEDTHLDSIAYNFFALIFHRGLHEKK